MRSTRGTIPLGQDAHVRLRFTLHARRLHIVPRGTGAVTLDPKDGHGTLVNDTANTASPRNIRVVVVVVAVVVVSPGAVSLINGIDTRVVVVVVVLIIIVLVVVAAAAEGFAIVHIILGFFLLDLLVRFTVN